MGSLPVGLSGSRAAAILGLSQYSTPLSVWQDIMEKRRPGFNAEREFLYEPFTGNASTRFGHAFESSVIELAEQAHGGRIINQEGEYTAQKFGLDYVTCHIDGWYEGTQVLHEGKTVNERAFRTSWGEPGTDRIPAIYAAQVQHQLLCTGAEENILSALVFPKTADEWEEAGWEVVKGKEWHDKDNFYLVNGNTTCHPHSWAKALAQMGFFHQYTIQAKPDTHKLMLEMYEDFWERHVLTEQPPEITDYEDIRRCFPEPKGTLVVDNEMAAMLREYKDIGKEIGSGGHLKKRQGQLKTQILKFAHDKTTVADDDAQEKVVFRDDTGQKLGQFDGKTFRA